MTVIARFAARVRTSPLGSRLARGTFWAAAGAAASRAALLVTAIIVSRALGKSGLGAFGIIQNTVAMVQVVAGLGMGLAATKYVAEHRGADPRAAGRVIGLSLLVAGVSSILLAAALYVWSPWLASRVLAAPELARELRIGSGILVFTSLSAAAAGSLAGFEAFRGMAVASFAAALLTVPIVFAGVRWGGLTGAVWGLLVASAVSALVMGAALARKARGASVPVSFLPSSAGWRVVWDFGLPATLGGLVVAPVNWACAALLVNSPGGYDEMGVFNAANYWRLAIFNIPFVFGQVLTPMLAERAGAGDAHAVRKLLRAGVITMGIVCLAPVVIVGAFSPLIMRLYGGGFEGTHGVLIVLAATALLMAVVNPVGNVIAATGRMWAGFAMNLGWAVAAVALSWLAIGRGAFGLALAQLGAYALHAVWSFWYARRMTLR